MLILVLTAALLLRCANSQCVSNCGCSSLPDSCCLTVQENQPPDQIGEDDSAATITRIIDYSEPRFLFTGPNTEPGNDLIVFGAFQINAENGIVSTLRTLDREGEAFLGGDSCVILPVAVRETSGVNTFPLPIVLKVLDINDNVPFFENETFIISVREEKKKTIGTSHKKVF